MPPIEQKKDEAMELTAETDTSKKNQKNKKDDKTKIEENANTMSEEDIELKERLETCVSTLLNSENEASVTTPIRLQALNQIVTELRTATSSMTSVPKPLKFLRPFFDPLKQLHEELLLSVKDVDVDSMNMVNEEDGSKDLLLLRARLADVLAVLSMTLGKHEERESLSFKLSGMKDYATLEKFTKPAAAKEEDTKKKDDNLGSWGHEFVRSLTGEIGQEYNARVIAGADPDQDTPFADLLSMVDVIVPFHVNHNAEAEAVDLLLDVQRLKKLLDLDSIDAGNYRRICSYLIKTADFQSDPDDLKVSTSLLLVMAQISMYKYFAINLTSQFVVRFVFYDRKCLKPLTKST